MKKITTVALIVSALSVLLISTDFVIKPAYAMAGFQSYTQVNASTGTNDNCTGITTLPLTGYVVMVCRTPNNTSIRVLMANGTQISTSTVSTTTNNVFDCWAIDNLNAVCQVDTSNAVTGLRRITVTSLTTITATSFTNPCTVQLYHLAGSSLYGLCTGAGALAAGTIFRVSLSTFTQTGTWTGAAGNYLLPVSDTRMVTLSSATINYYSIPASSGAVTLLDTGTSITSYSTNNIHVSFAYDGTYLYYGRQDQLGEFATLSSTIIGTSGTFAQNFNDMKGIRPTVGNEQYWLFLGTNNQVYLLKKQSTVAPPNNFVAIQTVTVTFNLGARLGTSDSVNFVISKGATAGAVYFIRATDLRNENDNPIVNPNDDAGAGNQENGVCLNGTALECVGDRGAINAITGAPTITDTVNTLGNGLGIFNSTNTDIKTNGTGLLLMLMTGTFFASALLGTVHQLNAKGWISASVKDIDPIFWLFLVVGVISFSFYLGWIPDLVFYAMVVGIAGLFSFGIYKHFSARSG